MIEYKCTCDTKRTDGLPPCGKATGYERPDGYYCDCGHDVKCCKNYVIAKAERKGP